MIMINRYRTENTREEIKAELTCSICLDFYRFEP